MTREVLELTDELSKIGKVISIKNDFVFSLLMERDKENLSKNTLKIMELVTSYIGEEKEHIEVMFVDEEKLLIILKP